MIRNIVFDIGRVLIEFEWFDYVGKLFSKETAEKVTAAMWGTGYWKQLDIALLTDDEILELFYSAGPEYRKEIREAFDRVGECVKRRDWAIPMIDDLKSRGYRVYYLSNFSEHVMGSNPEALDFVSHMDGGIFSCDVKVIKPASEIYTKLIDKYDLLPEECLFIDDHRDNVAAAKKCGMKAIRFENREQLEADLDKALTKDRGHDRISVLYTEEEINDRIVKAGEWGLISLKPFETKETLTIIMSDGTHYIINVSDYNVGAELNNKYFIIETLDNPPRAMSSTVLHRTVATPHSPYSFQSDLARGKWHLLRCIERGA